MRRRFLLAAFALLLLTLWGCGGETAVDTRFQISLLAGEGYSRCCLKVSTANEEAFSLYRSEGFTVKEKHSTWYEVKRHV